MRPLGALFAPGDVVEVFGEQAYGSIFTFNYTLILIQIQDDCAWCGWFDRNGRWNTDLFPLLLLRRQS